MSSERYDDLALDMQTRLLSAEIVRTIGDTARTFAA